MKKTLLVSFGGRLEFKFCAYNNKVRELHQSKGGSFGFCTAVESCSYLLGYVIIHAISLESWTTTYTNSEAHRGIQIRGFAMISKGHCNIIEEYSQKPYLSHTHTLTKNYDTGEPTKPMGSQGCIINVWRCPRSYSNGR